MRRLNTRWGFAAGCIFLAGVIGCSSTVTENPTKKKDVEGVGGTGGETTWTSSTSNGGGGCGGASSSSGSGGTSSSSSSSGAGGTVSEGEPVFAVTKLFLGDTTRDGVSSSIAWKQYGFNVDGLVSTKNSKDLCKPPKGGTPSGTYPDGDDGIDNAFGKTFIPIFGGLVAEPTGSLQEKLDHGMSRLLFLDETLPPGSEQGPHSTRAYRTTDLGHPPALDGSDSWLAAPEGLMNWTDLASSTSVFLTSTLQDNLWASGQGTTLEVPMLLGDEALMLSIRLPRITMRLTPGHEAAIEGQIGGVLDTEEFIAAFRKLAGNFDPGLCSGSTWDSVANQLRGTSDILADGTQDPNKTCDGISVGLGFTATKALLAGIGPASPPPPNPCQ